ncbi:hypothetical protein [Siphonobacter sp. SORGH_AS_0500]|uniref:hypothetical protein n=1 Tax=Siphonobacter sp. SORGH_AS_0500 TaxID=1864824 RepID=UPI00285949A2|nr:hypothetical protein [Siphonobacter sp. SORGH_AS_0500]MDR6194912.1 hypothetical protein [Siphonobacter sp. SORGH_AS_0500]
MKKQSTPLTPEQQAQAESVFKALAPFMNCYSIRDINAFISEMFAVYVTSDHFVDDDTEPRMDKANMFMHLTGVLNDIVRAIPDGETRPTLKKAA